MSKHTFRWKGGYGFLDANVSAYAMKHGNVKINGVNLDPRRTFLPDDEIVFDDEDLALMLRGNGNWVEMPNATHRPRKKRNTKVNIKNDDKKRRGE